MIPLPDSYREYKNEVREWLQTNVPKEPLPHYYDSGGLEAHREWETQLREAGYAALNWPKEYGGGGADDVQQVIFAEEYELAGGPHRINRMGLGLAGPTIIKHGTEEQRSEWLQNILNCEDIWCQGFSEPEAGSDLAGLRTRAAIDGDHLVVNGHKTWSSYAKIATKMIALVRTDPDAPKHMGISFVVVDLNTPGIEIRPIEQLHGNPGFAEVLFEDARVPISNVVGDINDGWNVTMSTLAIERGSEGSKHAGLQVDLSKLIAAVEDSDLGWTAENMQRIGRTYAYVQAFRDAVYLGMRDPEPGRINAHPSYQKLLWSNVRATLYEQMWSVQGPMGEIVADNGSSFRFRGWQREYWHSRASRIFAGSDQIQRNIISERVLGLPKERSWQK